MRSRSEMLSSGTETLGMLHTLGDDGKMLIESMDPYLAMSELNPEMEEADRRDLINLWKRTLNLISESEVLEMVESYVNVHAHSIMYRKLVTSDQLFTACVEWVTNGVLNGVEKFESENFDRNFLKQQIKAMVQSRFELSIFYGLQQLIDLNNITALWVMRMLEERGDEEGNVTEEIKTQIKVMIERDHLPLAMEGIIVRAVRVWLIRKAMLKKTKRVLAWVLVSLMAVSSASLINTSCGGTADNVDISKKVND